MDEFEVMVRDAVLGLPNWIRDRLRNVSVEAEDEMPNELKMSLYGSTIPMSSGKPVETYGLFEGHPGRMDFPNRITLFRGPICRECGGDPEMMKEFTMAVVVHEVGHQMGLWEEDVGRDDPVVRVRRNLLELKSPP